MNISISETSTTTTTPKFNGCRASHRNRWLLIQNALLSIQEFSLLDYYIDIMDFDPGHGSFGTFKVNFEYLANLFHKRSDQTIRNWHKKLLNLGCISITKYTNVFSMPNPLRYLIAFGGKAIQYVRDEKNKPTDYVLQNIGIINQSTGNNLQKNGELPPDLPKQQPSIAISSYRVDYPYIHNEQEYREVQQYLEDFNNTIGDRWSDKDEGIQTFVRDYEYLASISLNYEVKNDLLPI